MTQAKTVKSLSDGAVAFLDAIHDAASSAFQALSLATLPAWRVLPGVSPRNTRGSSEGKTAQTYYAIPAHMDVSLIETTMDVGTKKRKVHVLNANGETKSHKVSDTATVLLSLLTYGDAFAREANKPRSTRDLVTDAFRALLFLASGYYPGVTGKAKDFKALVASAAKRGFNIEPIRTPIMELVGGKQVQARTKPAEGAKTGKPRFREDWTACTLSKNIVEAIDKAIGENDLPESVPAELTLDFANYLKPRDRKPTFVTATTKIGKTDVKVRITVAELAKAAKSFTDGLPQELKINVRLTDADLKAINSHVDREAYRESARSKAKKASDTAKNTPSAVGNTTGNAPVLVNPGRNRRPGAQATK